MAGQKSDDSMATGVHRPWVGESKTPLSRVNSPLRDTQRKWLDQRAPAPVSNPRHAAITGSLNSWSNYKSWTDKIRNSWDKDGKK